jgi:hypothetical protein
VGVQKQIILRLKHRRETKNKMVLKDIVCKDKGWNVLAQDRIQ